MVWKSVPLVYVKINVLVGKIVIKKQTRGLAVWHEQQKPVKNHLLAGMLPLYV